MISRRAAIGVGLLALVLAAIAVVFFRARIEERNAPINDPTITVERLPPRTFSIVAVHEHLQDRTQAERLVKAMDALGVRTAALMASSIYTFTLDKQYGFERFEENNEALLDIKKAYPGRFLAFVTVDPLREGSAELLEGYFLRGADGLKLYAGHGADHGKGPFHTMPLDDPRLMHLYEMLVARDAPLVLHTNLTQYYDEFVRVMRTHPTLRVNLPHWGLHKNTRSRLKKLGELLKTYPNLYTDMSYGHPDFQLKGFQQIERTTKETRRFIADHRDKILFSADMVLEKTKTDAFIIETLRSYMQILEMPRYRLFLAPDRTMTGLALPDETLRHIYEKNPAAFLKLPGHVP